MRNESLDFINKIVASCDNIAANNWNRKFALHKVINYLVSEIPSKSFCEIVSDPAWNKYPTYVYGDNVSKSLSLGRQVKDIVRDILFMNKKEHKNLLLSKSTGLFALHTLNLLYGQSRVVFAKRVIKNKDSRVRKLATKFAPISVIKKQLVSEGNSSVRRAMISRIGPENVSVSMIEEIMENKPEIFSRSNYDNYILFQSVSHQDKDFIVKFLNFCQEKQITVARTWFSRQIVESFLQQCSDTDILFYKNTLSSFSDESLVNKAIRQRIF